MKSEKPSKMKVPPDGDEEMRKIIGNRIRRIRLRFHKTAKEVAEKIGMKRGALSQVETGKNNISAVSLWKIACFLQCDIKDFFPNVPEAHSLNETDLAIIAEEDESAAKFIKQAFKPKKHETRRTS